MYRCLISLGANVGDREQQLHDALRHLRQHPEIEVRLVSRFHETLPVGGPLGQAPFLNAVAVLETSRTAHDLIETLQAIEQQSGRVRGERWSSRTLDLDLLLFENQILQSDALCVPHPRLSFRRFVLEPAVEVAADWLHPVLHQSLDALLRHLNTSANYIAIHGDPESVQSLVRAIDERLRPEEVAITWCYDPIGKGSRAPDVVAEERAVPGPPFDVEFDTQVRRFRRRCEALGKVKFAQQGPTVISDFWCSAPAVFADPGSDDGRRWLRLLNEVSPPLPRLLVLVAGELLPDQRLGRMLRDLYGGPVLSLSTGDPEWSADEVLAACLAMRETSSPS